VRKALALKILRTKRQGNRGVILPTREMEALTHREDAARVLEPLRHCLLKEYGRRLRLGVNAERLMRIRFASARE
jgi:hypothetical protein